MQAVDGNKEFIWSGLTDTTSYILLLSLLSYAYFLSVKICVHMKLEEMQ